MHRFHVTRKMYEPEAVAVPQQASEMHRYTHHSLPYLPQVRYRFTQYVAKVMTNATNISQPNQRPEMYTMQQI